MIEMLFTQLGDFWETFDQRSCAIFSLLFWALPLMFIEKNVFYSIDIDTCSTDMICMISHVCDLIHSYIISYQYFIHKP